MFGVRGISAQFDSPPNEPPQFEKLLARTKTRASGFRLDTSQYKKDPPPFAIERNCMYF